MRIALITEGITDQVVLEHLAAKFFRKTIGADLDITYLQPPIDATDTNQADFGGFEAVLEYCRGRIEEALAVCDHVLIHIDSDISEHPSIGIPLTKHGKELPEAEVFDALRGKILGQMPLEVADIFGDRIHVVVARHSIECWLLKFIDMKNSMDRIRNCEDRLFLVLAKNGVKFEKSARFYRNFCSKYLPKNIDKSNNYPDDMHRFFNILGAII